MVKKGNAIDSIHYPTIPKIHKHTIMCLVEFQVSSAREVCSWVAHTSVLLWDHTNIQLPMDPWPLSQKVRSLPPSHVIIPHRHGWIHAGFRGRDCYVMKYQSINNKWITSSWPVCCLNPVAWAKKYGKHVPSIKILVMFSPMCSLYGYIYQHLP